MFIIRFLLSYINIILLSSCVANHLRIGNRVQQIGADHIKRFINKFLVLQPSCSEQEARGIRIANVKQTIKTVQKYFGIQNNMGSIMEPFYFMHRNGRSDSITPLTRLNDYEDDKKEALLDFIKTLVVINSHLLMNCEALLRYVENWQMALNQTYGIQPCLAVACF